MKILKLEGGSQNQQEALLELLEQHAPEVFTENKIDVKQLRATLGEEVLADAERYGLNWAGKMDCFRTIQETTTNTLKPVREESVNFDDTENLFIEGDNLEVLKVLQRSYYGKVKMIYIDPPYNTGNDFIYNDKFSRNKREYLEEVGAIDKEGNVVNAGLYTQNTKDSGHFHSDWLNMMYPRLFLARNLLSQDGVVFISIDDNEVNNLRLAMNEIFGEQNFIAQIVAQLNPRGRNLDDYVAKTHEYVLIYAKDVSQDAVLNKLPKPEEMVDEYDQQDSGGKFRLLELRNRNPAFNKETRPNLFYPIFVNPQDGSLSLVKDVKHHVEVLPVDSRNQSTCWTWSKTKVTEEKSLLMPRQLKDGSWRIYRKDYLEDEEGVASQTLPKSVWFDKEINHDYGKKAIKELFGENIMSFPKSPYFLEKIIRLGANNDSIVLDFFAGSGTTAQAVMQLNAEDDGHRKWICVQLPEKCKPETEAAKAGYQTIADIAKERIRRAAKKIDAEVSEKRGYLNGLREVYGYDKNQIKEMQADMNAPAYDFDGGFKVFKLDESNFKIWNTHVTSVEQLEQQMIEMFDNVREGSTKEAMMFELILKSGKELNVAIEEKTAGGKKYFRINDGSLVICLADKLSKELFAGILAEKPKKIIVLDKSFGNDDQLKTNLLLHAEGAGVDEVRVI